MVMEVFGVVTNVIRSLKRGGQGKRLAFDGVFNLGLLADGQ